MKKLLIVMIMFCLAGIGFELSLLFLLNRQCTLLVLLQYPLFNLLLLRSLHEKLRSLLFSSSRRSLPDCTPARSESPVYCHPVPAPDAAIDILFQRWAVIFLHICLFLKFILTITTLFSQAKQVLGRALV